MAEIGAARVDPEWIKGQRERGWPDMHPEEFCHLCGARNPSWFVPNRVLWLTATKAWAAETGRDGICCPGCFAQMVEGATGQRVIWEFRVWEVAE